MLRSRQRLLAGALLLCFLIGTRTASGQNPQGTKYLEVEGFHFVLLVGQSKPGVPVFDAPPGVANALKDVSEFLPFKGFQLQDQAFVRNDGGGPCSVQLKGPNGREYTVSVGSNKPTVQSGNPILVLVKLTEQNVPVTESGKKVVLESGLSMRLGETAVVGTSGLKGQEGALVLLVTLVAPRDARGR